MQTHSFSQPKLLLLLLGFTLTSQLSAQCSISNPTEANSYPFQIDWEGKWNHISLYGDWGEDFFSFYAEYGKTYIFSTMPGFGGNTVNINNDDTQLSVLDAGNQPAPGRFGNAFHDDFAPYYGDYKPTFAWSPNQTGTYRLLVTKYENWPGCQELGSGEQVTVAFRRIDRTHNFAIWTGDTNSYWGADYCWLSRGTSGKPAMGRHCSLSDALVVMDNNGGATVGVLPTHAPPGPYSVTEEIQNLLIGPRMNLDILPQCTLKINYKLSMPMEWPPFSFAPHIGSIQSTDQNQPGSLHIIGTNAFMNIPNAGQLQHINLILETNQNASLIGTGSAFTGESVFNEIHIKGGDNFYISGKVRVKNKIQFHTDQVISLGTIDPYTSLTLAENAQIIGANAQRFIVTGSNSPVYKIWNSSQPFTLPIGDMIGPTKYYAPVQIDPQYSQPGIWRCEYQRDNPFYHYPKQTGIDHVSRYDKWHVSVDNTYDLAKITFQWNAGSGVGANLNDLLPVGMVSYNWESAGKSGVSGSSGSGQITTQNISINSFEYFSLASTSSEHGFRLGQQQASELSFICHPNPASSHTQIRLSQPMETPLQLRLVDLQGRQVLFTEIPAGQTSIALDISQLSAGIYYLSSHPSFSPGTFKLIKE